MPKPRKNNETTRTTFHHRHFVTHIHLSNFNSLSFRTMITITSMLASITVTFLIGIILVNLDINNVTLIIISHLLITFLAIQFYILWS